MNAEQYPLLEMAGRAAAWQDLGLPVPPRLQTAALSVNTIPFADFLAHERARLETLRSAMPHDRRYAVLHARHTLVWYVPEGRVFPLGDNRDNSRDGRYFGTVSESKVLGKGGVIFWPLRRLGSIR